jgi:2-polyprenyl-3-methyl-5-hydroxy-6-metoxy-1,4-benzoquinol methylase
MSSKGKLHEQDFKVEEYEQFYENHHFSPLNDQVALHAHRVLPRVNWALDVAKEIKPKRVLDLGCLDGYALLTVANHVKQVEKAVGVDLSEDGIKLATKRAKQENLPCIFFQDAIETFLEECTEQFDLILMFEVIEHVKSPRIVLELIDKVKAPDGTVLISTPDFEAPTYGKDDEQNKCHIRLYTTADKDYEAENRYGNIRKATSITKEVGKERVKEMGVYSELINVRYV